MLAPSNHVKHEKKKSELPQPDSRQIIEAAANL